MSIMSHLFCISLFSSAWFTRFQHKLTAYYFASLSTTERHVIVLEDSAAASPIALAVHRQTPCLHHLWKFRTRPAAHYYMLSRRVNTTNYAATHIYQVREQAGVISVFSGFASALLVASSPEVPANIFRHRQAGFGL